jgi:hypothetical protein
MCKWEDQIHKFVNGNLKLGKKKNIHLDKIWGTGSIPLKRIFTITKTQMDYSRGKMYRFGMEGSFITLGYWQHV